VHPYLYPSQTGAFYCFIDLQIFVGGMDSARHLGYSGEKAE
jgi:hypothetical protein